MNDRFLFVHELSRSQNKILSRVTDTKTGIDVAMKKILLSDGNISVVENEALILKSLHHENIIRCYSHFIDFNDKYCAIILELVEGMDLGIEIARRNQSDSFFENNHMYQITHQLLLALEYLNFNCIVHGDVKPSNIMLLRDRNVKLCDFGLAKILQPETHIMEEDSREKHQKDLRCLSGSPRYMAPELFCVGQLSSHYSDLWSLGCVIQELIQLKPLFRSSNLSELAQEIQSSVIHADLTHELSRACIELLVRDPSRRGTATTALTQLRDLMPCSDDDTE